jgi:hypothetical protein
MINYPRSSFTWHAHPWQKDPHYKWLGGFVGEYGQAYHVRFTLQASCTVVHPDASEPLELYLGAPCRSEYTIASRNMFQIPSGEWRMVFSHTHQVGTAESVDDPASSEARPLAEAFADHTIDIRHHDDRREHTDAESVIEATLANRSLSAETAYTDEHTGSSVTLAYPVNVMNLNVPDGEWQVCTGPIIVPDLASWDGDQISRVFVAHVAISDFDHVELIFRRPVEVAPEVVTWLDTARGRDRRELHDPNDPPAGYPPPRPRPTVYHDTWELPAINTVLSSE